MKPSKFQNNSFNYFNCTPYVLLMVHLKNCSTALPIKHVKKLFSILVNVCQGVHPSTRIHILGIVNILY